MPATVLLLAVLAGAWSTDAHLDDRRSLAASRLAAADAARVLADVEARHGAVRRQLSALVADVEEATSAEANARLATEAAMAEEEEAAAARDEASGGLGVVTGQLAGARSSLALARSHIDVQRADITALATCLDGIARARRALAQADRATAVTAMASVTDPCAAAERSAARGTGTAPVLPYDFADPFIVEHHGSYYGYATNGGGGHVQLVRSVDLATWEWLGNALPELPAWAGPNRTWAPAVLRRGSTWVLYYAAHETASGDQCISVATAGHPAGPYTDTSSGPFVCQRGEGGSIDPSPLLDAAGHPWLVWKGEGETAGGVATLWSQRLSDDGRSLVGAPHLLLGADRRWEQGTIEGPSMVAGPGGYHLLYSAASWNSAGYAVGHALCGSPAGPCVKQGDGPVLRSSGTVTGPGGAELVAAGGRLRVAFHAWAGDHVGYPNKRGLHVADVRFHGTAIVVSR